MAMIMSSISNFAKLLLKTPNYVGADLQQIRNKWCARRVARDMKRRKAVKDYAVDRLRLLGLKRNDILPREINEDACKQFDERIPRISALRQLTHRCVLTSKPRGVLRRWRVSRHVFRHLVDYNKLSGVQRAMW